MSRKRGSLLLSCWAALIMGVVAGCSEDPAAPPPPGVVRIRLEPYTLQADWTVTGPGDFRTSGTGDLRLTRRTGGEYSVVWADKPGWIAPQGETLTLTEGDSLVFVGAYLGAHWHLQNSGTGESLMSVSFADADIGTVVGMNGTILRTTDGGATWTSQDSGTREHLYAVDLADADTGIAVGKNNTVLSTSDGGTTWVPREVYFSSDLTGVDLHTATLGTAVGRHGTYYRTADGGETWEPQNVYTRWRYEVPDGWVATHYRIYDTELFAITYDPAGRIIVVGDYGFINRSGNNGLTWFPDTTSTVVQPLTGVDSPSPETSFVVGAAGTILRTTNGGASWDSLDGGTDVYFYAAGFADAFVGTVVGQGGTILRTTDGGDTWIPQVAGTFRFLLDVDFIDADTGTVVGEDGVILRTTTGGG